MNRCKESLFREEYSHEREEKLRIQFDLYIALLTMLQERKTERGQIQ